MDLSELLVWFITSFFGASIVKIIDIFTNRYSDNRKRKTEKVQKIQNYVKQLGELLQYYAFFGELSIESEGGNEEGESAKLSRFLEPEPRFENAIMSLEEADLRSVIAQKIASIRIASAEVHDLADQLDPAGGLKKQLGYLYLATTGVEKVLERKDKEFPYDSWQNFSRALSAANTLRKDILKLLEKYLK